SIVCRRLRRCESRSRRRPSRSRAKGRKAPFPRSPRPTQSCRGMMSDRPFSDEVVDGNRELWEAMQAHRFVREIEADRLAPAVFHRYLAYENAFVETAISIFGHLLVKAPGLAEQRWLIGVLKALSEDQITYFREAFQEIGLPESAWHGIA